MNEWEHMTIYMIEGASMFMVGTALGAIWLKLKKRDISELFKPSGSPVFIASLVIIFVIWKLFIFYVGVPAYLR